MEYFKYTRKKQREREEPDVIEFEQIVLYLIFLVAGILIGLSLGYNF